MHLGIKEIVPSVKNESKIDNKISKIADNTIDNIVKVDYIKVKADAPFDFNNGIIFFCKDKSKNIYEFYTVADGEIKPLEAKQNSTQIDYMGNSYNISFSYSIYNNSIVLYNKPVSANSETNALAMPIKNCIDKVLVTLSHGQQIDYTEYKVLLNINTSEVTDFLNKCNLSSINKIMSIDICDDLSKAIVRSDYGNDKYYFCNIVKGKVIKMKNYVNIELTSCLFIDNDTIFI